MVTQAGHDAEPQAGPAGLERSWWWEGFRRGIEDRVAEWMRKVVWEAGGLRPRAFPGFPGEG